MNKTNNKREASSRLHTNLVHAMIRRADGLLPNEMEFFHREGYLVVDRLFSDQDLAAVIDEIASEIDRRASDAFAVGELSSTFQQLAFEQRLTAITHETDQVIRGISSGALSGPSLFGLITHPRLLDVAESLCGPELIASSVYRLRPKLPSFGGGEVPWHQDSAYFDPYCDNSLILTVWLPLVDANEDNGCLFLVPGQHKNAVLPHQKNHDGSYLEIVPKHIEQERAIPVPVHKGGALLMTNRTPHASFQNRTDKIRWSLDIRFQSASLPTNASLSEELDGEPLGDDIPLACYPPSADFLVCSQLRPHDVIRDATQFQLVRQTHKFQLAPELAARVKSGARHVSVNPFSLLRWTPNEAP